MLSSIASSIHILALGIGLGAAFMRGRHLVHPMDHNQVNKVLAADAWWGLATLLWIVSGLWRLFGGLEKPVGWYLVNKAFHLKIMFISAGWALEAWPMLTFVGWRVAHSNGTAPNTTHVDWLRRINHLEVTILVVMVFVASAMARGIGYSSTAAAATSSAAAAAPGALNNACAVQQLMDGKCNVCHSATRHLGGLDMTTNFPASVINARSVGWPAEVLVVPGNAAASLFYKKVAGTQGAALGEPMPTAGILPAEDIQEVERWIVAGAPKCDPG